MRSIADFDNFPWCGQKTAVLLLFCEGHNTRAKFWVGVNIRPSSPWPATICDTSRKIFLMLHMTKIEAVAAPRHINVGRVRDICSLTSFASYWLLQIRRKTSPTLQSLHCYPYKTCLEVIGSDRLFLQQPEMKPFFGQYLIVLMDHAVDLRSSTTQTVIRDDGPPGTYSCADYL